LLDRRCFPIVPGKHPNLFLENIQRKTPMDQPLCLCRLGAFKQYRRFLEEGKRRMPGLKKSRLGSVAEERKDAHLWVL